MFALFLLLSVLLDLSCLTCVLVSCSQFSFQFTLFHTLTSSCPQFPCVVLSLFVLVIVISSPLLSSWLFSLILFIVCLFSPSGFIQSLLLFSLWFYLFYFIWQIRGAVAQKVEQAVHQSLGLWFNDHIFQLPMLTNMNECVYDRVKCYRYGVRNTV